MEKEIGFNISQKQIGIIIIFIAIALFFVVQFYTQTILTYGEELHKTCPLPAGVCPYKKGLLPLESALGYFIIAMLGGLGAYLVFVSKKVEKVATIGRSKLKSAIKGLHGDEKSVYQILLDSDGSAFQSDIVTKTGFSKVKVSRILDRLETKGIVERRRRGMSNVIILKSLILF